MPAAQISLSHHHQCYDDHKMMIVTRGGRRITLSFAEGGGSHIKKIITFTMTMTMKMMVMMTMTMMMMVMKGCR